jgi:hypothetical protein
VAFDSYWSSPNSEGSGENVMYRFGSVGQVFSYTKHFFALTLRVYLDLYLRIEQC